MSARLELAGERYGRLTVICEARNEGRGRQWYCECGCGTEVIVSQESLRSGNTRSCGCLKAEQLAERNRGRATHGHSRYGQRTLTYRSWDSMRTRCLNPSGASNIRNYAGVTIDPRWDSFEAFLEDMGPRPAPWLTLDRINPWGSYSASNCRWATKDEQSRNQRRTRMNPTAVAAIREAYAAGKGLQSDIAKTHGVQQTTISKIVRGERWNFGAVAA
jgi:hypothetical protein